MGLLDDTFLDTLLPDSNDSGGKVFVTIRTDGDCFMRCDGEFIEAEFKAGQITKIELPTGQHILEFQLASDPSVIIERIVDYPEKGKSYLEIVRGIRPKTDAEKKQDAIDKFEKKVQEFLDDDKRIDPQEAKELEDLRRMLGLDVDTATRLINEARRQVRQESRTLSQAKGRTVSLEELKEAVFKDDTKKVCLMLPDVASAIESGDKESKENKALQCWYYMCITALQPMDLIKLHETSIEDNYWRSYWVTIAYSRNKHQAETQNTIEDLRDLYAEYPEENLCLLSAVHALNHLGKKEAQACMEQAGDAFSPELQPFAEAIKLELGLSKATLKQAYNKFVFFQDRIVSFESPEERAARKEKEKDLLRKKVTYTVSVTGVENSQSTAATMRREFGWASAVSAHKLAKLPLVVLVTEDAVKARSIYDTLGKGGMRVEVIGVNALGEKVDDCLGLRREVELNRSLYVIRKDSLSGYMDKTGKEVIPCQFDQAYDFKEGLARVEKKKTFSFIDKTGKTVIQLESGYKAYDVSEGLIRVQKTSTEKYGYIDVLGNWVVKPKYDEAFDFNDELAQVYYKEWVFINKKGLVIERLNSGGHRFGRERSKRENMNFSEGLSVFSKREWIGRGDDKYKYGYQNKSGCIVIKAEKYDEAFAFREGLARVGGNDHGIHYGFIDKNGKEITPLIYKRAHDFHEGMAAIEKYLNGNTLWGYISTSGLEKIKCKFEEAGDFHDGMAKIKYNGKWGYIKKQSWQEWDITPKYDIAYDFHEGLAKVELNGKYGYIDKEGNAVTEIIYDIA